MAWREWGDHHAAMLLAGWIALALLGLCRYRRRRQSGAVVSTARCVGTAGTAAPGPLPRALRRDMLVAFTVAGLGLLGALALSVMTGSAAGPLWRGDQAVVALMRSSLGVPLLQALAAFTVVGSLPAMAVVGAAVAVGLFASRQWLLAAIWIVATVGNGLLVRAVKQAVGRVRPEHLHRVASEDGFSFPSGHAAGSTVVYGLLAYLVVRWCPPRWQRAVWVGAALWVLAIGFSRVMLQVHYLSDVLAGWLMGLVWLLLVAGTAERARRW